MKAEVFLKMFEEKYGKVEILDKVLLIQAHSMFNEILASSNKSERSKVIAEVMEWANDAKRLDDYWTRNDVIDYDGLTDKLDSMEQEVQHESD